MERIKSRIFGGLAALALAGGALAAAGPGASAATTACGATCVTLASQAAGLGDVMAVLIPRFAIPGKPQSVVLSAAGNVSSEDWRLVDEGTVAPFYAQGIVGAAVGQTWPSNEVYEFEYTPGGKYTGLCLGTSVTAANGTPVVLQTCGINSQTLWIPLESDSTGSFLPLVNGSDTVVNTPYVLTAGPVGASLTTAELSTVGGAISPTQMWRAQLGPL
jgi:hypothetical protein